MLEDFHQQINVLPLKNSNIFPSTPEESFLNFYNFDTPKKFLCSLTRGVITRFLLLRKCHG